MTAALAVRRPVDWPLLPPAGVSDAAMALLAASEVVDLHLDSYIVHRLVGYDLNRRHGRGPLGGRMFGHLDFPTAVASGLTGGMWSITTNPLRSPAARWRVFQANLQRFQAVIAASEGRVRVVRDYAEWRAARQDGAHGCLLAIQGGNALEAAPNGAASIPDRSVTRVTLVHLTNACYGPTSSPLSLGKAASAGLTAAGRELVRQLDDARVFVDLAHIGPRAFWDAVDAHDPGLPLLATHTGVDGVTPHWRNLSDDQIRAIARTGGVIGVVFQAEFLRRPGGPRDASMVVEHMEHIANVGGEDAVALGSDYDGAIIPPPDLRDGFAPARLIDIRLRRGWSEAQVQKALGLNFLRCFEAIRPGSGAA